MKKEAIVRLHASFEELVQHDETGNEFWLARDLQELLGYARWENFEGVVRRAEQLVLNSAARGNLTKCSRPIAIGSGAVRDVVDYRIDRDGLELLGLLTTSFKLNGFFLARNETVLLSLLAKWATKKGLTAKAQFRVEQYVFDLMIADSLLLEFDEPHHTSSRQLRVDQAKELAAKRAGFKTLRLGLSLDVVDAILEIESMLGSASSPPDSLASLAAQRARLIVKAKDFAGEIANCKVKVDDESSGSAVSSEHGKHEKDVLDLLGS